ncbi:MAG: type II secretion system F family protein [Candidatus Omnitrophica bacterium]|nr:type II secretion system F family protein [Candidatus Omnitrophota bacterium]
MDYGIIGIMLFLYAGIALILWAYFGFPKIHLKLPDEIRTYKKRKGYPILVWLFPLSAPLLHKTRMDVAIKRRIDTAHVNLSPVEFFNLKILLAFILGALAFFLQPGNPIFMIVGIPIGFIFPDFYLSRKVKQRRHDIVMHLPETVDLLTLCVEAGFDFTSALKWIIEKTTPNPMIEELAFVMEEIKWGKPRMQAIKDMGKRLNIAEINSFVQTLKQAENMGTPVAEALSNLAEDTRHQRFLRGERLAMQAPVKMLIPLVFCILPVIVIVVAAPVLIQFTKGSTFPTKGAGAYMGAGARGK